MDSFFVLFRTGRNSMIWRRTFHGGGAVWCPVCAFGAHLSREMSAELDQGNASLDHRRTERRRYRLAAVCRMSRQNALAQAATWSTVGSRGKLVSGPQAAWVL